MPGDSSVTPLEHTAIGALAGLTEVSIMQPTVAIKNALQEGRPVPRSPLALYRGLLVNAGGMLPICATQFGVNRLLEQTYRTAFQRAPGDGGTIALAMGAGAASSLFGCPAEYMMIQQQKSGRKLLAELKHTVQAHGALKPYKGLGATAMRESLYAAGYLGVCPILRESLEQVPALQSTPGAPFIISGITAGLLATVTTQPADTIKTRMQAFPDSVAHPEYRSFSSTVRHIVQTEGPGTLFAGLIPRSMRIICAVFILNGTRSTLVDAIELHRQPALA